jgi:hypothetical protein
MLAKTQDNEEIIERVAALDIGKAGLVCCVRVPDEDRRGRRLQEVESYSAMTRSLLSMADRLACLGVRRVVMEATSEYWEAGVLPAGSGRVRGLAGERQGCQAPAGAAEDRQAGLHLAVQGRRAADDPAQCCGEHGSLTCKRGLRTCGPAPGSGTTIIVWVPYL